ncbi:MAG: AAC(3) family N-acetyltransferase, partial [Acidimicrobiaceae bacterium]|nr:AAC(3) family N-acetyltransferase [Acidimicrobiaceae bacterium]
DLRSLGLGPGENVIVHSSLSALGYVIGGAHAVVLALLEVVGPEGTLVVPTHSGELSDPRDWENPPVPEAWWPKIRECMPAYDARLSPTRKMGAVPEVIRHLPGALRSAHPTHSFCAVGPQAEKITREHRLEYGFDEHSPLARLYDLNARVLLLGVDHDRNTSLHLAESRACRSRQVIEQGSPIVRDGERQWTRYTTLNYDTRDFVQVGDAAGEAGLERTALVGAAFARLLEQPRLVDFAVDWFLANRI